MSIIMRIMFRRNGMLQCVSSSELQYVYNILLFPSLFFFPLSFLYFHVVIYSSFHVILLANFVWLVHLGYNPNQLVFFLFLFAALLVVN